MAYNDYGAFVRRNGERMESHEDAVLERLDGGSGGQAVFDHLAQGSGGDLYHAVLGDGEWRLGVYKTTFPYLWHHEDGRWHMADLLSYAVGKPRFACEDERYERMTEDKVTRPVDLFDWVRGLPEDGLECVVPGGPTVIIGRGRHHARWHGPTIHVSMTEADGTRWDAEAGDRYGAGFEDEAERRGREVRAIVGYLGAVAPMGWRRVARCPRCGAKPAVGRPWTDLFGRRTIAIRCPECGLRLGLRLLEKVDYATDHLVDPKATAWAAANLTQLVVSMWNRQANDAKDMRGILSGRERSFWLTLDGRSVGEMEWRA